MAAGKWWVDGDRRLGESGLVLSVPVDKIQYRLILALAIARNGISQQILFFC